MTFFFILTRMTWFNFAINGGMSVFHILRTLSMGHAFSQILILHSRHLWATVPLFLLNIRPASSMLQMRTFSTRRKILVFKQILTDHLRSPVTNSLVSLNIHLLIHVYTNLKFKHTFKFWKGPNLSSFLW